MVVSARKLSEIAAAVDPKQGLLTALGDYSGYECFHNRVLVATYVAADRVITRDDGTKTTLHMPDNKRVEDRFQSRCGLVLKLGPLAFKDDNVAKFGGIVVKEGDWVVYTPSNGREIFFTQNKIDGVPCRIIEDAYIDGRIDDPSKLY